MEGAYYTGGDLLYSRHLDRRNIDVKVFHEEMRIATFPSGGQRINWMQLTPRVL